MNQLGITSWVDMMNLRLQYCCAYGRQKPIEDRVGCGAPEIITGRSFGRGLHSRGGFCMLSVSRKKPFYRRIARTWGSKF